MGEELTPSFARVQLEMVPLLDIAQPAVTAGAAATTASGAAAKTSTATATTSTDGSPANGASSSKGAPRSRRDHSGARYANCARSITTKGQSHVACGINSFSPCMSQAGTMYDACWSVSMLVTSSADPHPTPTLNLTLTVYPGLLPTSFPTTGATETVEVDPPRAGPGSSPSASHTGAGTFRSPQEQAKEVVSQVWVTVVRMCEHA